MGQSGNVLKYGHEKKCGGSEEVQLILPEEFKEGSMEEATFVQVLGVGYREIE